MSATVDGIMGGKGVFSNNDNNKIKYSFNLLSYLIRQPIFDGRADRSYHSLGIGMVRSLHVRDAAGWNNCRPYDARR